LFVSFALFAADWLVPVGEATLLWNIRAVVTAKSEESAKEEASAIDAPCTPPPPPLPPPPPTHPPPPQPESFATATTTAKAEASSHILDYEIPLFWHDKIKVLDIV